MTDLTDRQWTAAESYVRADVKKLCAEWGVPEDRLKIVFRSKQRSDCRYLWFAPDGTFYRVTDRASRLMNQYERAASLRFGWQDVGATYANHGLREYRQCQHLVRGQPTGVEALGYMVRHEFAHALVWITAEADGEKPHGPAFVETYRQLLEGWDLWQHETYV